MSATTPVTLVVLDEQSPARHSLTKWCYQNTCCVELVHARTVAETVAVCQQRKVDAIFVAAQLDSQSGQAVSQKLLVHLPRMPIFVAQESLSPQHANEHDPVQLVQTLSWRERQVFEMVVEGKSSGEIALQLGLSSKTVDTYRSRLMQKLRVDDLPNLVRIAIRAGVTSLVTC